MAEPAYACGLKGVDQSDNLTSTYFEHLSGEVDSFVVGKSAEGGVTRKDLGNLPGFLLDYPARKIQVLGVHSLWDLRDCRESGLTARQLEDGVLADAMADADPDLEIRFVDLFNLVRRPEWVFEKLVT